MKRIYRIMVGFLLLGGANVHAAQIHGRLELQDIGAFETARSLDSHLGYRDRNDAGANLRLMWRPDWGRWSAGVAYEVSADYGDSTALAARLAKSGVFPAAPPDNWWNLSNRFAHATRLIATQYIDRLWLGYTTGHLVVRLGRQALTWGSGLVFHPMDLFNPFAPNAIDTDYKAGTDMAYGQWLFDDGADLQVVVAPRARHRLGGAPTSNSSTYAARFQAAFGAYQTSWLLARDRGDLMVGIGVNGDLGQATWNVEVLPTLVNHGKTYTSLLANISDATTIWGRNVTLFTEYYRNGFGLDARRYALINLPASLRERLLRGQVFDTGRDYLAVGTKVQCTGLLHINPTLIANLDDRSLFGVVQATYSVTEDLNLVIGGQFGVGPANTEFGGLPLLASLPVYEEQPKEVYVQLRQYF
ncbi:MAG: hypothetical protein KGO02_11950 [Alphaproteobacteria bacterium]|nr:hypothetical protein [Alphaproteobacteria bacterium]